VEVCHFSKELFLKGRKIGGRDLRGQIESLGGGMNLRTLAGGFEVKVITKLPKQSPIYMTP
jgi:signal transduction histidine kinase